MWLFLPLAYLAGAHGFALFAPYLAVFLAVAYLLRKALTRKPQPLPVRVEVTRVSR